MSRISLLAVVSLSLLLSVSADAQFGNRRPAPRQGSVSPGAGTGGRGDWFFRLKGELNRDDMAQVEFYGIDENGNIIQQDPAEAMANDNCWATNMPIILQGGERTSGDTICCPDGNRHRSIVNDRLKCAQDGGVPEEQDFRGATFANGTPIPSEMTDQCVGVKCNQNCDQNASRYPRDPRAEGGGSGTPISQAGRNRDWYSDDTDDADKEAKEDIKDMKEAKEEEREMEAKQKEVDRQKELLEKAQAEKEKARKELAATEKKEGRMAKKAAGTPTGKAAQDKINAAKEKLENAVREKEHIAKWIEYLEGRIKEHEQKRDDALNRVRNRHDIMPNPDGRPLSYEEMEAMMIAMYGDAYWRRYQEIGGVRVDMGAVDPVPDMGGEESGLDENGPGEGMWVCNEQGRVVLDGGGRMGGASGAVGEGREGMGVPEQTGNPGDPTFFGDHCTERSCFQAGGGQSAGLSLQNCPENSVVSRQFGGSSMNCGRPIEWQYDKGGGFSQ